MTPTTDRKMLPFLAALCLFLAAVEYAIPKPLPFLRLGLANLPVIIALYIMPAKDVAKLIFLKIIGQGVITGTLLSYIFVFSAAGSLASGLTMLAAYKIFKDRISCIGLSLAGAAANNLAQLAVACLILFGSATKYIAPILLTSGAATGLMLGVFAQQFIKKSRWFELVKKEASNG